MATIYTFPVIYTKAGVATAPSSAPTIQIVDSSDNILVAAGTAVTASANMPGAYYYAYTGADNLILWALFHTTDTTVDQQDLGAYTPAQTYIIKNNVATILADYARRTGDYAVPGDSMDVATWLGVAPAALSANGYVQSILMRWLTDNAAGTPDALSSNKLPADVKLWLASAPAALSTNGYIQAMLVRWLIDNAAGTPLALASQLVQATFIASGGGSVAKNVYIKHGGVPIDGVDVWVTTDLAGTNVIARGYTNALGLIVFYLDPGTYYAWKALAGYTFTNPESFTVP